MDIRMSSLFILEMQIATKIANYLETWLLF